MAGGTKGKDPLLSPGLLFVPSGTAEGRIKFVLVEGLLETFGLHYVGVQGRTVNERIDPLIDPFLINVNQQIKAVFGRDAVAKLDHFPELPGGVHMHQRKGRPSRVEGLARQVQHDRRILTDRIEHYRILEFGGNFANDVDTFRFQLFQVSHDVLQ